MNKNQNLFLTLLFILVQSISLMAQDSIQANTNDVVVASIKLNELYVGINNPIYVTWDLNKIVTLKTDNGKLGEENGSYFINPKHIGKCTITLLNSRNEKKIFAFRVKEIPEPEVTLSNFPSGSVLDKNILMEGALICYYRNGPDVFFNIKQYDGFVRTLDGKLIAISGDHARFSTEVKEIFSKLSSGDIVLFYNVIVSIEVVNDSDKKEYYPIPAKFIIK